MGYVEEGITYKIISWIRRSKRAKILLLAGPSIIFLAIFFFSPFIIAVMLSLNMFEKVVYKFIFVPRVSLEFYMEFISLPNIQFIFYKSFYYAIITTIGTILISYPMAYYMAFKVDRKYRNILLFIIFLPFWVNFIVRIYAIKFILHGRGPFQQALIALGIIHEPLKILGTDNAVIIAMIYSYLIYMLLPVYGVVEKINREYIEAAYTLGAHPVKAFLKVTLPLSLPGIVAGTLLVFIPALGEFIIPVLVGGAQTATLGLLIYQYTIKIIGPIGWSLGSAAAVLYIILILIASYLYFKFVGKEVVLG
ncbi:ABC transporter permease [Candidatus Geothermarchaeota archaeon]|nr:MAG: ABC transporter permease [Candidatus Geothermarchaeota archaeon]